MAGSTSIPSRRKKPRRRFAPRNLDLPRRPDHTGRVKGLGMKGRPLGISALLGVLLAGAAAWPSAPDGASAAPIRGFPADRVAAERTFERRFREQLDSRSIETWHRYFTSKPHPATSARTKEIAEYVAAQWKAQ